MSCSYIAPTTTTTTPDHHHLLVAGGTEDAPACFRLALDSIELREEVLQAGGVSTYLPHKLQPGTEGIISKFLHIIFAHLLLWLALPKEKAVIDLRLEIIGTTDNPISLTPMTTSWLVYISSHHDRS